MKVLCAAVVTGVLAMTTAVSAAEKAVPETLQFKMKSLAGKDVDLSNYQGKVLLVVNVASKCGATPQYEQLQGLHEKYKGQGLAVLGFPCNQFGGQEPGTASDIQSFCKDRYSVTFDLFDKIDVKGADAAPLFKLLTSKETKPKGAGDVGWNFEKFVIGRNGEVVARFGTSVKPDAKDVVSVIETELAKK